MHSIAMIVGSTRAGSFNQWLADLAVSVAPAELAIQQVAINQLPFYSQDIEQDLPASVVTYKQQLAAANGVLVVTPEYNRSIPGLLKNALDWASRPAGQSIWANKPVGLMGASTGQFGTITAQFELRRIMTHVGALVMPQPQVLVGNAPQRLVNGQWDEATTKVVTTYLQAWQAWIETVNV